MKLIRFVYEYFKYFPQFHEYKILQSELDSQKPSIEALNISSRELMSSSNQRLAKKVEAKLKDLNSRFEKVSEKVSKRGELLEEVSHNEALVSFCSE